MSQTPFLTALRLHEVISDAIWMAEYSGLLESPCEIADWVVEELGFERLRDGIGPWPWHHETAITRIGESTPTPGAE